VVSPLRHGTLEATQVSGHAITSHPTLTCSENKTVIVRAVFAPTDPRSTIPLRVDHSVSSHLTVNGVDGSTGVRINVSATARWPTSLDLTSTLDTTTPSAGALEGSAVLIVEIL
jgi:hypothetical protein